VSRVDPRTGKLALVATLTSAAPQDPMLASWKATTLEGSLFILDPTTQVSEAGNEGGGSLYRVTPSGL
jgi:hypothetical protein